MNSKTKKSISKERLLKAVSATYDDSYFWVCIGTETGKSFFEGLYRHKSCRYSKDELIQLITDSSYSEFLSIPGHDGSLAISERHYIYISSIDEAQEYLATANADGFTHLVCEYNKHYDVYYKIDRTNETITFALGDFKRTLPLISHTEWAWKLKPAELLCSDIDHLDKSFQDPLWRNMAIKLGRKALKIKSIYGGN